VVGVDGLTAQLKMPPRRVRTETLRNPHPFWFSSHVIREPTGGFPPRGSHIHPSHTDHTYCHEENPMYDMYPDWGPASHHPENPRSAEAVQASLDLRDNGGERPDDN
jgi:hypothetical protein